MCIYGLYVTNDPFFRTTYNPPVQFIWFSPSNVLRDSHYSFLCVSTRKKKVIFSFNFFLSQSLLLWRERQKREDNSLSLSLSFKHLLSFFLFYEKTYPSGVILRSLKFLLQSIELGLRLLERLLGLLLLQLVLARRRLQRGKRDRKRG